MGRGHKRTDGRPWHQSSHQGQPDSRSGGGHAAEGGSSRSWSFWSGAWKSSPRQGQKPEKPAFPAYDVGWKNAAELMEVSSSSGRGGANPANVGGIVQDVQAAINHARKIEQRLHKLQKESLQKGNAWDAWVREMRLTYAKELERHRGEQKRLAADIRELEDLTHAAYVSVQQAALHQRAAEKAEPPPLEWEEAMEIDDDLTEDQTRAELRRMIQAAEVTPKRGTGAPPHSPPRSSAWPGTEEAPMTAVTDVYPTPPGLADTVARANAVNALDPRTPVAPSSHGQSALAAKLSDKRRACRQAMAPFGLGRTGTTPAPDPGQEPPGAMPPEIRTGLIHDDPDELAASGPLKDRWRDVSGWGLRWGSPPPPAPSVNADHVSRSSFGCQALLKCLSFLLSLGRRVGNIMVSGLFAACVEL
ncbi:unnamed protein product [Symbiodinium sp. CCMP2456]|nr:unnamed protein product [Symbiodinium sp. CCMP2456]